MKLARSATFLVVAIAVMLAIYAANGSRSACEASDGKWASASNTCIARDCFKTKSCGEWASPNARCNRIKPGDSRADVYFQLGMPSQDSAISAIWSAEKGSSLQVVAQFSDEVLSALSCPVSTQ